MKNITIALIAYNEEKNIPALIGDLSGQSIFSEAGYRTDIVVVANGCTDDTEHVARTALQARFDTVPWTVAALEIPSKTNAWNCFVHEMLPDTADLVIVMDADVRIEQPDLLAGLCRFLDHDDRAQIALGTSRKFFPDASSFGFVQLSRRLLSGMISSGPGGFCGQLYCARAADLRQIVLPTGLLSQDGFIRAMVLTSGLTEPEDPARIRMVPGLSHLHPDHVSLRTVFGYEKRQAIGTTLYTLVYDELRTLPPDFRERMAFLKERNATDPAWVNTLLRRRIGQESGGSRIVPARYRLRAYRVLKTRRGMRWLFGVITLPVLLGFDAVTARAAERELRQGRFGTLEGNRGKFKIRRD